MTAENSQHRSAVAVRERKRLFDALGAIPDGGILEDVQHIGATSVGDEEAGACLDIGLCVWPFPLDADRLAALRSLGYALLPEGSSAGRAETPDEAAKEQRFRHETEPIQLFCVESGSPLWTEYKLLRDYLRANEEAREKYAYHKRTLAAVCRFDAAAYQVTRSRLFAESLNAARLWWIARIGFTALQTTLRELEGVNCAWHVAGGWAIDLFLGRVTRVHHDTDILIARADQLLWQEAMRERGWKWVAPSEGRLESWPPRMKLELPRNQAHAHRDGQFLDFLLGDIEGGVWRFRRNQAVVRTCERLYLTSADSISFLAPEVSLLYKSKSGKAGWRDKDMEDFEKVHSLLDPERLAWLRWALTVTDAGHPWLPHLEDSTSAG